MTFRDSWEMHDLSDDFLNSIPPKLAGLDEIVGLYAANKQVQYLPEVPFRTLFIELRKKRSGDATPQAILEIITKRIDSEKFHYFVILDNQWAQTLDKLISIPGTRFYWSQEAIK